MLQYVTLDLGVVGHVRVDETDVLRLGVNNRVGTIIVIDYWEVSLPLRLEAGASSRLYTKLWFVDHLDHLDHPCAPGAPS